MVVIPAPTDASANATSTASSNMKIDAMIKLKKPARKVADIRLCLHTIVIAITIKKESSDIPIKSPILIPPCSYI